jgi:hypothetical protein
MMEAPWNIGTVIISIVNMESAENGCQPLPVLVLIQHSIYIHASTGLNASYIRLIFFCRYLTGLG